MPIYSYIMKIYYFFSCMHLLIILICINLYLYSLIIFICTVHIKGDNNISSRIDLRSVINSMYCESKCHNIQIKICLILKCCILIYVREKNTNNTVWVWTLGRPHVRVIRMKCAYGPSSFIPDWLTFGWNRAQSSLLQPCQSIL